MRRTGVRAGVRSLVVLVVCCAVGLVGSPAVVLGEGTPSSGGSGASMLFGGSLVVPGGLEEGQQAQVVEEARWSSPEAVEAREASETSYEGLGAEAAARLAQRAFPTTIGSPAGGPPQLPGGQTIVGYPADNVAQVDLGKGRHGVIESTAPIAVESSLGRRVPVDLGLSNMGNAFEPATPVVRVRIPKRLGEGVQLADTGVSLTPVDMSGGALGGNL